MVVLSPYKIVNGVETIDLVVDQKADRLDRYLSEQLPHLSRSRIQKLIEERQVTVNGEICVVKKNEVQPGDRLTLKIPPPQPIDLIPEAMPLDILYEDEDLLIINKPAGLVVHPSAGHQTGTLVHGILAHCPDLQGIGGEQRPGIVHRLDKDTTGVLAIAKTETALHHLQAQLKAKTARRDYLGIVHGSPATHSGTINQPLGRHPLDRHKIAIIPIAKGGRSAITHWQIQERLGNYTLIHFQLETGRTHQIRVHSAAIGHPLVGDLTYSRGRSLGVNLPGQALHAWRLRLEHPTKKEWIETIAPPPPEFTTLLEVLRLRQGLPTSSGKAQKQQY